MSQAKAWMERTRLLLGDTRVDELAACHVLVVGLGGVGGYASELLARRGIGRLTTVEPAERLRDINPEVQLEVIEDFLKDENMVELLDRHRYDFVVDAIDSLSPKVYLIALARERGLPIVSSMGAGAKSDPSKIHQADLAHSYNCTLARALRKRLRKLGISRGVPVVFSSELPDESAVLEIEGERCKRSTAGTISYMPALFGCQLAAYVLQHIHASSAIPPQHAPTGN